VLAAEQQPSKNEVAQYNKPDTLLDTLREQRRKEHRCSSCVYGKWSANVLYCAFAKCARERLDAHGRKLLERKAMGFGYD